MTYRIAVIVLLFMINPVCAQDRYAALTIAKRDKSELAKAMSLIVSTATPKVSQETREKLIREYEESPSNKGQAVELTTPGYWRSGSHEKQAVAGERTLEGCQLRYGKPCALIAVNDEITSEGALVPKDMVRLQYAGKFDLDQIPVLRLSLRRRGDVLQYDRAMEPKAMAIHPWGRLFVATGNSTVKSATEEALAKCNADPSRNGRDGPCFLYAVNSDVVLAKRMTIAP
jgi:hypothetical protein